MEISTNANYRNMLLKVVKDGDRRDSRVGKMNEVLGFQVTMPSNLLLYRPGMSRKLGWVESLMVIAGSFDNRLLQMAAPNLLWPYTVHQAYGLKLAQQLPRVWEQLVEFPETRRAMLHIGQPADGYEEEKPCVQSYQFLQRDGVLNMIAYARSWDLVSGFLYDTMVMGLLTQVMARVLEVVPGQVIATAGSGHIYDVDIDEGRLPSSKHTRKHLHYQLKQDLEFDTWESAQHWAQDNLRNFGYWKFPVPDGLEVTP